MQVFLQQRLARIVLAVGFRESSVAFGDISGDRGSGAVELVAQETVAAGKLLGSGADFVGKIESFLVDKQLFELEFLRAPLQ